MEFDLKTVNELLDIDEAYKAPSRLLELMLDDKKRVETFEKFLSISTDLSFDWFHEYFEDEQAERKTRKQDFTPDSIAKLLQGLAKNGNVYYEPTAGTGGMLIKRWWKDRVTDPQGKKFRSHYKSDFFKNAAVFSYDPRAYWYQVEELSDRATPFLIFNMAIRGMNGVIIQCDSLSRMAKEVYFMRNNSSNYLAFSEVIKMPHNDEVKEAFSIKGWK